MRAPASRCRDAAPLSVAMTPMIDVVFLLLVFFLCTASFQRPETELAARLVVAAVSGEGAAESAEPSPVLDDVSVSGVVVGGATVWTVNDGPSTADVAQLDRLLVEVAAISADLPVTIEAGPTVPLADLVAVYDAARKAGFSTVQIAADAAALDVPAGDVSR
ncbi:biopolymer transporter ExbD [Botrimarina hoheduenensis]|uniref:Biopolymer transport protein ExbD/TolR n=1 Tax=Botrimarina hoheduenensis TaxID=2528000 RepID=A0A5C5W8W2_9BACT|nr:biopolymer transporter ExbD [Botrimarina hoheduenensis]TWT46469.1 Biopolymer transport protein ExbD/TolR [Botrimarina hoheduenensis]